MKAVLFTFSRQGVQTSKRIMASLSPAWDCLLYAPEKYTEEGVQALTRDLACETGSRWAQVDALIYVAACGIAVRAIGPWLRDKTRDPAVICVDVKGCFAISLLSGHIGGANSLARTIAEAIGAIPVITTATDLNQRFAVDEWACKHGFVISSLAAAKAVSAAILEGDVPFQSDGPVNGPLPPGLIPGQDGPVGLCFSTRTKEPFDTTLRLIPKALVLGIGCRRGTSKAQILTAIEALFTQHGLDPRAIKACASITLKADEQGLVEACAHLGLPLVFHTPEALAALTGEFTASPFVQHITGVDNVCERSAAMGGGRIIIKKTAREGVTLALAEEHWEVQFG